MSILASLCFCTLHNSIAIQRDNIIIAVYYETFFHLFYKDFCDLTNS